MYMKALCLGGLQLSALTKKGLRRFDLQELAGKLHPLALCPDEEGIKTPPRRHSRQQRRALALCPDEEGIKTSSLLERLERIASSSLP